MTQTDFEFIILGFALFLTFYYVGVCVFSFYQFLK